MLNTLTTIEKGKPSMVQERIRRPTPPGIILKEIYLDGLGIGISEFAEHIGVSRKTVSAIVNGHARVTPELAVRFELALPTSSAEMWLNLQQECDLFDALRLVPLASVRPFVIPTMSTQTDTRITPRTTPH